MPRFRYKAIAADGQVQKGEIEASSKEALIRNLQDSGHLPVGAWEIGTQPGLRQMLLKLYHRPRTVTMKDLVIFMSELATLLQAGLPLDHALKTMADLTVKPAMKDTIHAILQRIQAGDNLSDAMAMQTGVFSQLQISLVRAGEASGELYKVIHGLAGYMERISELRSSVITALIYPAILLVMSVLSLFVLMSFVVPNFIPLFEDTGQILPLLTRITFGFAALLQQSWWILTGLGLFALWYGNRLLSDPVKRKRFDAWCLRLPYIGDLIRNIETARFARTLGTLVSNGVPLLMAVRLVKDVVSNRQLAEVIASTTGSLEQGQGFARTIRESQLFPPLSVQLIQVGEESGSLDDMLIKVAGIYDNEVQNSLKRMLTLLEPVLILGLGGLIGIIIISILMAMLGLNELVV